MSEHVTRRVRINGLSLASGPPAESIMVSFVTIDTPQQYSGTIIISRVEVKKLNVTVGDELDLTIAPLVK